MSTDAPRRGRPRDEAVTARIANATREAVERYGVRGASATAIAGLAGVGKPSVYTRHANAEAAVAAELEAAVACVYLNGDRGPLADAMAAVKYQERLPYGRFLVELMAVPEWRARIERAMAREDGVG